MQILFDCSIHIRMKREKNPCQPVGFCLASVMLKGMFSVSDIPISRNKMVFFFLLTLLFGLFFPFLHSLFYLVILTLRKLNTTAYFFLYEPSDITLPVFVWFFFASLKGKNM